MTVTPEQDFVPKTIKSRDVHFVRFWFTDVLGRMKSFAVIPSELEDAFADGMGFDGSCIEGFCRTQESDMLAFPDASTFQVLPWRPESNAVARMFCSIRTPDGAPFEGDPRHVLARTVARLLDGACRRTGARQALVVGGVASSALLRRLVGDRLSRLRSPVRVLYGQAQYSADNAAGVASIGMQRYLEEHS